MTAGALGGPGALAYVFWHYPGPEKDADRYERELAAFHTALQAAKPGGFIRSVAYRVEGAPWLPRQVGYEDWYEIRDWAALGALNAAAVSDPARPSHDAVAGLADGGAGGIFRLLRPGDDPPGSCLWFTKPRGIPYPDFLSTVQLRFPDDWALWQRQLVLGPAPEFCAAGSDVLPRSVDLPTSGQARLVRRRPVTS